MPAPENTAKSAVRVDSHAIHGGDLLLSRVPSSCDSSFGYEHVFVGRISGENHPNIVTDFHLREPFVDILNADPADPVVLRIGHRVTRVKMQSRVD
jgi:hypothetical protein